METAPYLQTDDSSPWATAAGPLGSAPGAPPPDPMMAGGVPQMPMGAPDAEPSPDADFNQNPGMDMSHPNSIEAAAAGVHHERLARMMSKVGDLFGGGTSYKLVENQDGTVDVHPTAATAGEKWARIAQAAVQGLAHGWAAGQGPGGGARALAAGVDTGTNLAAARQKEARDLSQQYTKQNRDKQLFDANMKLMQLETAKRIYDRDRAGVLDHRTDDDYLNHIEETAKAMNADVNTYDDIDALSHDMTDPNNPLFQAWKENRTRIYHSGTPEHPHRGSVVVIPENHMKDLYQQDWTPKQAHFDPLNLDKPIYYTDGPTLLKGYKTVEDMNAIMQKQELDNEKVKSDLAEARQKKAQIETQRKVAEANVRQSDAAAAASRANVGLIGAKTEAIKATTAGGGGVTNPEITPPDARFPSREYFPTGEPGIMPYDNPKNRTYKLDRDATTRENGAHSVLSNVDAIKNILGVDANGNVTKPLSGDLAEAIKNKSESELTGISGNNSELGAFIKAVEQVTQASIGIHGRNSSLVNKSIKETLNNFLNDPKAMIASFNQEAYSARQFADDAAQKRNYGNRIPEGRRYAVADNWWKQRNATIVDRGNESREATIRFNTPDKNGNYWQGPQSVAAQILASQRLGAINAVGGTQ